MDVIALSQAGFPQAVAPLGTALTEEQIAELWRLVPEPTLCFDGDTAGERAAARAAERALPLLKPGQSLRFAMLPEGEDPDTLILAEGSAAMRRAAGPAPCRWTRSSGGACWPARPWTRPSARRACARRSISSCPGSRTRACRRPIGPSSTPGWRSCSIPAPPRPLPRPGGFPGTSGETGARWSAGRAALGSGADPGRGGDAPDGGGPYPVAVQHDSGRPDPSSRADRASTRGAGASDFAGAST